MHKTDGWVRDVPAVVEETIRYLVEKKGLSSS